MTTDAAKRDLPRDPYDDLEAAFALPPEERHNRWPDYFAPDGQMYGDRE